MACSIRFYSKFGKQASKKIVDIVRVNKSQLDEAVTFMVDNFLDDPLVRSMGISRSHIETPNFLSKLWEILLKQELSLAAVKGKKICGLSINCPQTYSDANSSEKYDIFLKLSEATGQGGIRNILRAWDKIDREIRFPKTQKNENKKIKALELSFCAVARQHRRTGIAKKIISTSEDLAKMLGYDYTRLDSTNPATAKVCQQLGWKRIWEMPFERFDGVHKEALEHDNMKVQVYIKSLQAASSGKSIIKP